MHGNGSYSVIVIRQDSAAFSRVPCCFSFDEIREMTKKIQGWGSFTEVYKGVVADTGEEVALKRLRSDDQFKHQMKVLRRLHYDNLVGCVGFYYAKGEQIIVYEYMPNDMLARWQEYEQNRSWPVCKKICFGVAAGIHYLHAVSRPKIIHRRIHPGNILLDANLEPKIAGFGRAVLCHDEVSSKEFTEEYNGQHTAPEFDHDSGQRR